MELRDVVVDIFLFVTTFRQRLENRTLPDVQALKSEARTILTRVDQAVAPNQVLKARYEKIKFGLVALIDEVVQTSEWAHAGEWESLEWEYFQSMVAGDQLYDIIEGLTPADGDLIEVCFFILTLGFHGKYHFDEARWEETVNRLYMQLPNRLLDEGSRLTPESYHVVPKQARKLDPLFSLGRYVILFIGIMIMSIAFYFVAWETNVADIRKKSERALDLMGSQELKTSLQERLR